MKYLTTPQPLAVLMALSAAQAELYGCNKNVTMRILAEAIAAKSAVT